MDYQLQSLRGSFDELLSHQFPLTIYPRYSYYPGLAQTIHFQEGTAESIDSATEMSSDAKSIIFRELSHIEQSDSKEILRPKAILFAREPFVWVKSGITMNNLTTPVGYPFGAQMIHFTKPFTFKTWVQLVEIEWTHIHTQEDFEFKFWDGSSRSGLGHREKKVKAKVFSLWRVRNLPDNHGQGQNTERNVVFLSGLINPVEMPLFIEGFKALHRLEKTPQLQFKMINVDDAERGQWYMDIITSFLRHNGFNALACDQSGDFAITITVSKVDKKSVNLDVSGSVQTLQWDRINNVPVYRLSLPWVLQFDRMLTLDKRPKHIRLLRQGHTHSVVGGQHQMTHVTYEVKYTKKIGLIKFHVPGHHEGP
ncbi:hypothetical protein OIO90_002374 [Microbotryomycetes sp. JL221]|nr:hypothetical protein OIO90_002374 [Microbotryomycetes sp. JL221]